MKKQNNTEEIKMKTKIFLIAVIVTFGVSSKLSLADGKVINIDKNSTENSKAIENEINAYYADLLSDISESNYLSGLLKTENEAVLEVETWMYSEIEIVQTEEEIKIESWMSQPFELQNTDSVDQENELEIEGWMVNF